MKIAGIYRIAVTPPGRSPKYYIGQSNNLVLRKKQHLERFRQRNHYNKAVQEDVNKYGIDAIRFETLLICEPTCQILSMYEQRVLDSYDPASVYNVRLRCVNSPLGTRQSAASNAKRAASMRGQKRRPESVLRSAQARTGQKRSVEAKLRMAAARAGRKLSDQHKANIGRAGKGRKYGPRSDETRAKISRALAGKRRGPLSPETKIKIGRATKGRVVSIETRKKLSIVHLKRRAQALSDHPPI